MAGAPRVGPADRADTTRITRIKAPPLILWAVPLPDVPLQLPASVAALQNVESSTA